MKMVKKKLYLQEFRIPTDEKREDGTTINKDFINVMIMDFDVIEEGIDEVYQTKPKKAVESNSEGNMMNEFYPDGYSEDTLPF